MYQTKNKDKESKQHNSQVKGANTRDTNNIRYQTQNKDKQNKKHKTVR